MYLVIPQKPRDLASVQNDNQGNDDQFLIDEYTNKCLLINNRLLINE